MTTVAPRDEPRVSVGDRVSRLARITTRSGLLVVGSAFAIVLGLVTDSVGVVYPIVVGLGIAAVFALSALALHRFEWFVWVILLVRPALDLTRIGESGAKGSGPLATLVGAAIIVAGSVWLAARAQSGTRIPLGTVSRALLLLMIASVPSVLGSPQPVESARDVARTLGAVVLFVVLEQMLRSRRQARNLLVVCALSTLVPLSAGLVQVFVGSGRQADGLSRVVGSFSHPNSFGLFLVVTILMGITLRRYLTGRTRWLVTALILVSAVELVLTYSRGSWIVLTIGLLVVGIVADRRLIAVLPVVVAVAMAVPAVQARLGDLFTEDTVGGRPGNSASWRFAHIEELLEASRGQNLFGAGPKMSDTLTEGGRLPHNDLVRVFVETGILGTLCYVAFLVGLVVVAVRALRTLRTGFDRGLAVGYLAVVVAFVVDSMGANLISQFVLLIYVLALTAIVQAWTNHSDQPEPEPEPEPGFVDARPGSDVASPHTRTHDRGERLPDGDQ